MKKLARRLDWLLWKALEKAGKYWVYLDMNKGRTAVGNCTNCIPGGLKKYYGKAPNIVIKCLNCGHEQKTSGIYGWRLGGEQQWIDTQPGN